MPARARALVYKKYRLNTGIRGGNRERRSHELGDGNEGEKPTWSSGWMTYRWQTGGEVELVDPMAHDNRQETSTRSELGLRGGGDESAIVVIGETLVDPAPPS